MIRIMSFNIRCGNCDDGDNAWNQRKDRVLARIRAFSPDLLGVQECRDDAQAEYLKANLPEYQFYGVRRGGGGVTDVEMAPILIRKAAFQIVQTGRFWLSETPRKTGSKSWDAVFARTAAWAELRHRGSGRSLTFLNTHFDYMPQAIQGAAQQLRAWDVTLACLRTALAGWDEAEGWHLVLEFPMRRLGRRIDAVLVTPRAVIVLEFKAGATVFTPACSQVSRR